MDYNELDVVNQYTLLVLPFVLLFLGALVARLWVFLK